MKLFGAQISKSSRTKGSPRQIWRAESIVFVAMLLAASCTTGGDEGRPPPSGDRVRDSLMLLTVSRAGPGKGTVTSSPGSIKCGTFCRDWFVKDTVMTLTATPDAGSAFDAWSGDCSGPTCVVTMNDFKTVTATFQAVDSEEPPADEPEPSSGSGIFRIVVTGLWVHAESYDDILEYDGKGDEVFLSVGESVFDSNAEPIIEGHETTSVVMGDTNGYPGRQEAGSLSGVGEPRPGLDIDDRHPTAEPWVLSGQPTRDRMPFLVAQVNLNGGEAIAITPSVWEWDGRGNGLKDWSLWISDSFDAAMPSLKQIFTNPSPTVSPSAGGVVTPSFVLTAISAGLRALATVPSGDVGDRPIGTGGSRTATTFNPKIIVFTAETARWLIANDLGKGFGVLEINYKDDTQATGNSANYSLFIQVTEV